MTPALAIGIAALLAAIQFASGVAMILLWTAGICAVLMVAAALIL